MVDVQSVVGVGDVRCQNVEEQGVHLHHRGMEMDAADQHTTIALKGHVGIRLG